MPAVPLPRGWHWRDPGLRPLEACAVHSGFQTGARPSTKAYMATYMPPVKVPSTWVRFSSSIAWRRLEASRMLHKFFGHPDTVFRVLGDGLGHIQGGAVEFVRCHHARDKAQVGASSARPDLMAAALHLAALEASRMSHAKARPRPPPTAAMTGLSHSCIANINSLKSSWYLKTKPSWPMPAVPVMSQGAAKACKSAPTEKPLPSPARIKTRVCRSYCKLLKQCNRS